MKKYLLFLSVLVFSFVFSLGVAQAAIVRVQTNTGSNDGSTNTVSAIWSNPTTQGNLLVAIVGLMAEPTTTITPPTSDWQFAVGVRSTTSGTNNITTAIYYVPNASSQSGSSTWTFPNQAFGDVATLTLVEYSGIDPSNPLHTTGYSNYPNSQIPGGSATLGDSGTTTPDYSAGEVAVAGITTASGNTNFSAETNSFTEESEIASILTPMAPGIRTVFEDRMPTLAPGNQGVQATIFGTYTTPTWAWAGVIATFNPEPLTDTGAGETDLCANIDGVQLTVPDGYEVDAASGNCVESGIGTGAGGTDLCVNIDGVQLTVPAGYVVDATTGDCVEAGKGIAPFTDIGSSWASTYIQQLYSMGVVSGRTSTTFAPDENLTRAEMVKIADLAFGYAIMEGGMPTFKDVKLTDWFAKYLAVAEKNGIISGYSNGTFMPNNNITRSEALKILLAAAANSTNSASDIFDRWGNLIFFTDVDPSAWYAKYVNFAFTNEIVSGKSPTLFAPGDNITRGEMSKLSVLTTRKFSLGQVGQLNPVLCKMAIGGATNCGKLVIIKNTSPLSSQVFNFNGGLGAFNLDNDGGVVAPHSAIPNSRTFNVPTGTYTVNEVSAAPDYYLSDLSCVSNNTSGPIKVLTYLHDPVTTDFSGVTVGVPVGETITCTFTNTRGPGHTGTGDNTATNGLSEGMEGTIVGLGGKIMYSNDAGLTWITRSSGVTNTLRGVSFFDKHNGIAVGDNGAVTKSTDDGVTWTAQTSGTTQNLNGVSFSTSNVVTAVGYGGTIRRSLDGGVTWTSQTSGTLNQLVGVSFFGANNGVAVGESGTILRTVDGGSTWTTQVSGYGYGTTLHEVTMSTSLIGTVVGDTAGHPLILRTTDGGVTWTSQTVPSFSTPSHRSIGGWFDASGSHGVVVGEQALILTTTNSGTTWTLQTSVPMTNVFVGPQFFYADSFYKLPYTNSNVGVVVGGGSSISRTINGGTSWTDITNPFTSVDTGFYGVDLH